LGVTNEANAGSENFSPLAELFGEEHRENDRYRRSDENITITPAEQQKRGNEKTHKFSAFLFLVVF
jgi:hypothetical protein